MLCENCGNNEANVKYTQIVNGNKKVMHLCDKCAEEMGVGNFSMKMPISMTDFIGDFFDEYEDALALPTFVKKATREKCENCGLTYNEFVKTGLLGCPKCYETFEERLRPVIKNIQGNIKHIGRTPERISKNEIKRQEPKTAKKCEVKVSKEEKLQEELKRAIKEERYEDAAKIRDEIKKIK